jgi:hypothetical protein
VSKATVSGEQQAVSSREGPVTVSRRQPGGQRMKGESFLRTAARFADIVLAGGAVFCLLAWLYILYAYGWTGQRTITSPLGLAMYYVLPISLAILLFGSLRLKPSYRITAALSCLLLTASAYGLEGFLRRSESTPSLSQIRIMPANEKTKMVDKLAKQFGVDIDIRDQHEVIAALQNQSIEAVPQVSLHLLKEESSGHSAISIQGVEVAPLGGIANRLTVVCNQNGKPLMYESDERGFHNPKGLWRSEHMDIAAVGNSLTLGYCVPSDENFVALIRRRYPATLNLGMPGEGPLRILATLKEYARPFKPKLVLWFYSEANSLPELQEEEQSRILMRYLEDDFKQALLANQSAIDQALTADIPRRTAVETSRRQSKKESNAGAVADSLPLLKLSRLRAHLGLVYGKDEREAEVEGATMNLLQKTLSQANNRVSAWGGKLYFIYLPSWDRYAGNNPESADRQRAQVLTYVDSLGISVIDLHPAFEALSDPLSLFPFRGPGHYNQEGHGLVAEEVLKVISSSKPDHPLVTSAAR